MRAPQYHPAAAKQRGAVLMVMLVIMVMGIAAILIGSLSSAALQIERDRVTAAVLAQARDALIGYAASVRFAGGAERPGDLPCPDTNNDGLAEASCGNASGSTGQVLRLGRLPWKTLGLADLRDGSGERLWYAVSNNFKRATRTALLNSDTPGTITVRDSSGNVLNNGSTASGAVAVIIAPGDALQRTDKTALQDRSAGGINVPENYLDIANGEDNANFADGSATNGFIQGKAKDSNGRIILNDQLLAITQDNIMRPIQMRVAGEARLCLADYAAQAQNQGLYPWAAKLNGSTVPSYADVSGTLFGRLPDTFTDTVASSGGAMKNGWTTACNLNLGSWWSNWKEMVFYGLANAYKPAAPPTPPAANACASAGACLSVNPPSATADKKFVVIVAGKKLAGQARSSNADKGTPGNYLEAPNSGGAAAFSQGAASTSFNDVVVFQ